MPDSQVNGADGAQPGLFHVRSIAIIGAGPVGLACAKYLVSQHAFPQIVVFERQSQVGGVWNYSAHPAPTASLPVPQTSAHFDPDDTPLKSAQRNERDGEGAPAFPTPMYDKLNTNIPHPLMRYSDLSFPSGVEIFPTREVVQRYLEEYAEEIRSLIRFSTSVEDITPSLTIPTRWTVRSRDLLSDRSTQQSFDAVVVASGHYAVPFIPDIEGLAAFNKAHSGVISHSKLYRNPDPYRGRKVLVVGNGASGLDIALQIRQVSRELIVSAQTPTPDEVREHVGFEEVAEIKEFLVQEHAVLLGDGRVIRDIDAVLFCTGYLFTFPFFEKLVPPLVTDGRRVHGLYKHLFHINHPTLVFPGLPIKVVPFPLAEAQGALVARIWANELDLPAREEMREWERKTVEMHGPGVHVFPKGGDGEYINELHDWVSRAEGSKGKEPPYWDDELLWERSIYAQARMKFEETGRKAKTLEELGFRYESEKRGAEKVEGLSGPGFNVAG